MEQQQEPASGVTAQYGRLALAGQRQGTLPPAAIVRGETDKIYVGSEHGMMQQGSSLVESSKASIEMPPISRVDPTYKSLAPQNMTIDITTKRSMPISEEKEAEDSDGNEEREEQRPRESPKQLSRTLRAPSGDQISRITDKRFSRVTRSQQRKGSPHSLRGTLASSAKQSIVLELSRDSFSRALQVSNKKYSKVRSKLEGYHEPQVLARKLAQLEALIQQQKQQVGALQLTNQQLKLENQQSKEVNRRLFEEMTAREDERRDVLQNTSTSTMLQGSMRFNESIGGGSSLHNASYSGSQNQAMLPSIHQGAQKTQRHNRVSTFGELHSIYQDLFLTDMKKEMSRAHDRISQIQEKHETAQEEIDSLRKNNMSLNSTVKRYRQMMAEVQSKKNQQALLAHVGEESDTRSVHSSIADSVPSLHPGGTHYHSEKNPHSFAPSSVLERSRTMAAPILDAKRLEFFERMIAQLGKEQMTLLEILVGFLQELKGLMSCSTANAFLFDQSFARMLRDTGVKKKDQIATHLQKVYFAGDWIDVVCTGSRDLEEPAFNVTEEVRQGILKPGALVQPVLSFSEQVLESSEDMWGRRGSGGSQRMTTQGSEWTERPKNEHMWMGIQCFGKKGADGKKKRGFTRVDQLLLRVLCNWLSQRLSVVLQKQENQAKQRVVQHAIEMTSTVTVQKTQKFMFATMRKVLPAFFGFEDCSVLSYNPDSHELFTVSDSKEDTAQPALSSTVGGHKGSTASIAASEDTKSLSISERKVGTAATGVSRTAVGAGRRDSSHSFSSQVLQDAMHTRVTQSLVDMNSHVQEHELIIFPSTIGVTGYVFQEKTSYFSNKPEEDAKWNPDIDNLGTVSKVRNFFIAAIYDSQERAAGVIQLINKKDAKPIGEVDVQRFEKMRAFFGTCLENTEITHLTLSVTLGVKEAMEEVMRQFEQYELEVGLVDEQQNETVGVNPINALEKHVDMLKRKLTEMSERK